MISIRIPSPVSVLILLLLSCCCMVGCQFAPKKLPDSWKWGEDDRPALPDRILAVWTDNQEFVDSVDAFSFISKIKPIRLKLTVS